MLRLSIALALLTAGGCGTPPARPIANPGPDRTAQVGVTVPFDGSGSTGTITSYTWDFGDGSATATGVQVTHTYTANGDYGAALTVRGPGGADTKTAVIHVGPSVGKPVAICPPATSAQTGQPTSFSGNGSDPGGVSITTYTWTFSDDSSTATGQTVTHTYASAGSFTVSLVVGTSDGRTSDPCTTPVTVTTPVNYSGAWILNPAGTSMTGCSQFGQSFPAACLAIGQDGGWMTATPAGNGWPGGVTLSGSEDPPPAAPGTFRLQATMGATTMGSCSSANPTESVVLNFTSPTTATGTWQVLYSFSCVPAQTCSFSCNCDAQQTFTSATTTSCP